LFINRGKTRQRLLPGLTLFAIEESRHHAPPQGPWVPSVAWLETINGTQVTESDGNYWPPPRGETMVDRGSEFYTRKVEIVNGKAPYTILPVFVGGSQPGSWDYRVRYSPVANFLSVHDDATFWAKTDKPSRIRASALIDYSSSRTKLVTKGAAAVAACAPGNPIANAATAIGEFLQDVPKLPGISLWESRLKALGTLAAAGEFLNYQFGIAPTIGDMDDFLKAVHKVDKLVDQFIRDSGRLVRRSFHFPKETSRPYDGSPLGHTFSPAGAFYLPNAGVYGHEQVANVGSQMPVYETLLEQTVEQECWFSGAFTYHMPRGYDNHVYSDRRRLMAKLFGAEPDLNTLWNLAPWSWAVDWFSDVGSLVKNLQSKINYGTVMQYGYVMEKTTVTSTFSAGKLLNGPQVSLPRPYPVVSPVTIRVTTKKRVQANPFGFGVTWDGLSPTQLAIAAALGITRVVK